MKKLTTAFLVCLFSIASITALADRGDRGPRGPSPEEKVERMTEELNLSEDQAASLLEIFTTADLEREAMRAEHEALIRQDMCALFTSTNSQVEAVLSADQYAQLEEKMQRRADHRAEHANWRGKGGKGRPSLEDCETASESA